ncbi:unnamed protein product [Mytilus coruscus]|uniref:Uncharacterized protein n=1 Tax=Mytilus coruscus TaxID=42192 RepID=A0A6J7ZRR0_MYTCO|nr:unnamed protein product [Mytilus coruscus]
MYLDLDAYTSLICGYKIYRSYEENILDEYHNAWIVSSMNNENLRSCEGRLIKLDKKELEHFVQQFVNKLIREGNASCVLHLIHVFCIPGQEEKIKLVKVSLNKVLHFMTEQERSYMFKRYITQQLNVTSNLSEIDFLTGQIDPQHEFQLKVCYWDIFCAKIDNEGCKKFLQKNADYLVSNIEMKFLGKEKTKLIFCKILLSLLNWNKHIAQTSVTLQNMERPAYLPFSLEADTSTNFSFTAYTVSDILIKLLLTHSEDDIITTFNNHPEQKDAVKSDIISKIEPYNEFMLKLCYYTEEWTENEVDVITRNAEYFLSMVEEVNKRNHLMTKLKMCQVLNIIMNGEIHITESMIHSATQMCENDAGKVLMMEQFLTETNLYEYWEKVYHMIACILLLKTRLDDFRELTKILIQYQGYIKELLLSLLADMLTWLSAQQINEIFYLLLEKSFLSIPNIKLELAKTFLEISINPKISHYKKTIIGSKIQPTLISHDTSKTASPLTTEFTDSTWKKMDHKRIINICINIVKTESKDINLPMYEGIFCTEKKAIENEDEMVKRSQETETLVLLMLLLITTTTTGHHKSAKLKKYLSLKYEYATASLYLLWCSGDIEVHPGPSLKKKSLAHDSSVERTWIQNISPKIIIRLPELLQSKYKATHKVRDDRENRDHFKTLLKTCLEEKVHVPKMYLAEINTWETMEYKLLHKLFVYRCEIETIITSLQDFLTSGGSIKDLTDINVSFDTELKANEIPMVLGKDQRPKDKSQLMVYITRHIAGILIKCAHGKDPDAKCDGLWDLPLENWPKHIILFDPNNRGKYSRKYPGQKLISDQELVDILVTLPQVTIPQKYKDIVEAFKAMRKNKTKQHKVELCSTFKRTTSFEKMDYALKNLHENGIFTEKVYNDLTKWWTTRDVETGDDQMSQRNMDDKEKKGRPHILIKLYTKCITINVEPTSESSSHVSYNFPLNDEFVAFKKLASAANQNKLQSHSSDFYKKVTAKECLKMSQTLHANLTDEQTDSIIIPQEEINIPNSCVSVYPSWHAILENDIKLQQNTSAQDPASSSLTHLDQSISSTFQFSQSNIQTAVSGQLVSIISVPDQSTTNADDLEYSTLSVRDVSQNFDLCKPISPTSNVGSLDSISSITTEIGLDSGHQFKALNGNQLLQTNSDYSSDNSSNADSQSNLTIGSKMKKRKYKAEDNDQMKERKKPLLGPVKMQTETNNCQKVSSVDNSIIFSKNMDLLLDFHGIDLDSFDFHDLSADKTFDLTVIDNESKILQSRDDTVNLVKDNIQQSNDNTANALGQFLVEMINCETESMKSYL